MTMFDMDPAVLALQNLIATTKGGRVAVADRLGVNEQTLYQIAAGIKLRSGKPRGVGRQLRELLDQHYPGWLTLEPISAPTRAIAGASLAADLAAMLRELDDVALEKARKALATLAESPDSPRAMQSLDRALSAPAQADVSVSRTKGAA